MPTIPTTPSSVRVRVWRRLQAVGAVTLKSSVYVLPNREDCVETFEWVARELSELGGHASVCEGHFVDAETDDEIERRFAETRSADYAALADDARVTAKKVKARRLPAARLHALAGEHARLAKRLADLAAIDFFHAPGREGAEGLVTAIGVALAAHSASGTRAEPLAAIPRPQRATWVTRTGVHVDRIASAWLIRRFIDPGATLKFVPAKGYAPEPGELRFDMYDAEFTHVGDRCTFEVLLERMRLDDPALAALGEIIHDIDLRDEKFAREETAGVTSAINGICAKHRGDLERIAAATPVLEAFYEHFALHARKRPGRSSSRSAGRAR